MEAKHAPLRDRPHFADGYLLVEAIVGVVLLGVGALGVAAALGQAEQLAAAAVQRDREAGIRADLAIVVAFGLAGTSGWQPATGAGVIPLAAADASGRASCWSRITAVAEGFLWIEARCGVRAGDLAADRREPGLLVRR